MSRRPTVRETLVWMGGLFGLLVVAAGLLVMFTLSAWLGFVLLALGGALLVTLAGRDAPPPPPS